MASGGCVPPAILAMVGMAVPVLVANSLHHLSSFSGVHAVLMTAGWVGFPSLARGFFLCGHKALHGIFSAIGLICALAGVGVKFIERRAGAIGLIKHTGSAIDANDDKVQLREIHAWLGWLCTLAICLYVIRMMWDPSTMKGPKILRVGRVILAAGSAEIVLAVCSFGVASSMKGVINSMVVLALVLHCALKPQASALDEKLLANADSTDDLST
eukprot:TRINITY_DN44525_c0_g1_i1.p1 TRINITY_DN44525_c0_g1~~TRINITY_DN44525_c0_g1_i1.p1  ORF type:complete len:214 (+),score=21.26 TRINITY_DN44525_c0_g1_i1:67-708(+)